MIEGIDLDASVCTTSTTRGLFELEGDDFDGALRLDDRTAGERSPAALREIVRFDAGQRLDRRRAPCRGARSRCSTTTSRIGRARTRSPDSPTRSRTICRACSQQTTPTTTPTRSRPCGWQGPRSSCAPPTSHGSSGRGRGCDAAARPDHLRLEGAFVQAGAPARLRSRARPRASLPPPGTTRSRTSTALSAEMSAIARLAGQMASTARGAFDRRTARARRARLAGRRTCRCRGSDGTTTGSATRSRRPGRAPTIELGASRLSATSTSTASTCCGASRCSLRTSSPSRPVGTSSRSAHARSPPMLAETRRPRARWRTRVVANGNLRWIRTSFLGRAPGFAPEPPFVGPWRTVELRERPRLRADVRTLVDGRDGVIEIRCSRDAGPLEVDIESGTTHLPAGGGRVRATEPEQWWPHTHGEPALHEIRIRTEHQRARSQRRLSPALECAETRSAMGSTCTSTASRSSRAVPSGRSSAGRELRADAGARS